MVTETATPEVVDQTLALEEARGYIGFLEAERADLRKYAVDLRGTIRDLRESLSQTHEENARLQRKMESWSARLPKAPLAIEPAPASNDHRVLNAIAAVIALPVSFGLIVRKAISPAAWKARLRDFWMFSVATAVYRQSGIAIAEPASMSVDDYRRWREATDPIMKRRAIATLAAKP